MKAATFESISQRVFLHKQVGVVWNLPNQVSFHHVLLNLGLVVHTCSKDFKLQLL
jgi:hypothetical protein